MVLSWWYQHVTRESRTIIPPMALGVHCSRRRRLMCTRSLPIKRWLFGRASDPPARQDNRSAAADSSVTSAQDQSRRLMCYTTGPPPPAALTTPLQRPTRLPNRHTDFSQYRSTNMTLFELVINFRIAGIRR